ncbi:MAG: CP12 domain-containing protein [Geitlerinemataceae cyanobacterium]
MKASDIMTTGVVTIKGSARVSEAVKLMRDRKLRALIVDRRTEDDTYGIITEVDIAYKVVAYGKDPKAMRVFEIMTKPCITVPPNLGVEYVARLFANTRIRRAPVVDTELRGVLSVTDIITQSDFDEAPASLKLSERIAAATAEARRITKEKGASSRESAIAWDTVEELQAEAAHQTDAPLTKTAFEMYCEENPSAPEARMYD